MSTNYRRMTTPNLIAKRSAKRIAEAEYRLAEWDMGPKNVKRLEAYLAGEDKPKAEKAKAAPAKEVVAQAVEVTKAMKATAALAFDKAFQDAPEGKKRLAGRRAYGLVLRGEAADHTTAAQAAVLSVTEA